MFSLADGTNEIAIDAINLFPYVSERPALFRLLGLHLHIVARSDWEGLRPTRPTLTDSDLETDPF